MDSIINLIFMTYQKYYEKYLGIIKNNYITIIENKFRDEPINKKYYYQFILSEVGNKKLLSISPLYYQLFLEYIKTHEFTKEKAINIIKEFLSKQRLNYSLKKMFRMSCLINKQNNESEIIFKEESNKCVIENNGKIVSYAKISDTYCNGANIVVYTDKNYRNKGYATKLLSFLTRYILNKKLIPIYLVEEQNKSSIACAIKNGYKLLNLEYVFSIDK